MRRDSMAGTALIAGALMGMVTMALHPMGHEVASDFVFGQAAWLISVGVLLLHRRAL
jgi:hypothetical protein